MPPRRQALPDIPNRKQDLKAWLKTEWNDERKYAANLVSKATPLPYRLRESCEQVESVCAVFAQSDSAFRGIRRRHEELRRCLCDLGSPKLSLVFDNSGDGLRPANQANHI